MAKKKSGNNAKWEKDPRWPKGQEHWVGVFRSMTHSPAYMSLSPEAKVVYQVIRDEYNGQGNTVICPYGTIVMYSGIRKNNVRKRLQELEAYKFLKVEEGKNQSKVGKPANQYVFNWEWMDITTEEAEEIKSGLKEQWKQSEEQRKKAREHVKKFLESNHN